MALEYKGIKINDSNEEIGSYYVFEDFNPLLTIELDQLISNGEIEEVLFYFFEEHENLEHIYFDCEADNFCAYTHDIELLKWLIDTVSEFTVEQIEEAIGI